jgi:UDP-GlcNAc:undecaprenyl-phosphate/decaprenyl-phosphate GlcNAc-1-phosphate transferase
MQYLLISFFVSLLTLFLILKTRIANIALDAPNQRSLHTKLTPRTGGLAIMAGVLISWLLMPINFYWILFPLTLMLISFVDDIYHLSIKWRLLMQLMASAAFILMMLPPQAWLLVALLTLLITWMANLYNFMDGSDGLAGGMGVFGFMAYAIAAYLVGNEQIALMSGAISLSCLAFLIFNFHPAKIFMGDSGSIPLGFLVGAIGLFGWKQEIWPAWFPILVFSPFIVDATTTLFKRFLKREKIWQAHKSHYYQRLVQMGWGHRKTALAEYLLMFSTALSAVFLKYQTMYIVVFGLLMWVIVYCVLMQMVDKSWRSFEN